VICKVDHKAGKQPMDGLGRPDINQGVYGISVAADLVGMGVQNLRLYERRGLVDPDRTDGGTRRYSEEDLVQLLRIRQLLADGLNLAGISLVFQLEAENARLRAKSAPRRKQVS
jgi:MerR family transcriptional regulator/heat shock protein HspR